MLHLRRPFRRSEQAARSRAFLAATAASATFRRSLIVMVDTESHVSVEVGLGQTSGTGDLHTLAYAVGEGVLNRRWRSWAELRYLVEAQQAPKLAALAAKATAERLYQVR